MLAKCQNPGYLRGITLRNLEPEAAHCFRPTIHRLPAEVDGRGSYLLNCNVDHPLIVQSAVNVVWLYE